MVRSGSAQISLSELKAITPESLYNQGVAYARHFSGKSNFDPERLHTADWHGWGCTYLLAGIRYAYSIEMQSHLSRAAFQFVTRDFTYMDLFRVLYSLGNREFFTEEIGKELDRTVADQVWNALTSEPQ